MPDDTADHVFGEVKGCLVSYFTLPDDAVRVGFAYSEDPTWIQTEELTDLNKPEMAFRIDSSEPEKVKEQRLSVYS